MASDRFEGSANFKRLAAAYEDECARLGYELEPGRGQQILADRVRQVARHLRVAHATVVRSYLGEETVRHWARDATSDLELDEMITANPEPIAIDTVLAADLLAGLGRVVHYSTEAMRRDGDHAAPQHLLKQSADVITALGLALREDGEDHVLEPSATISMERGQLVVARRALERVEERPHQDLGRRTRTGRFRRSRQ